MRMRTILGSAVTAAGLAAVALAPGAGATTEPAPTGGRSVAAVPPTVSPAADYIYASGPSDYTCPSETFCARVWDPTKRTYRVYMLRVCHTYQLANWEGIGGYVNRQTGDRATASFYGAAGQVLKKVKIGAQDTSYNWSPVWKIRNCY